MRILLDTHALLWWLLGERALPERARDAILDRGNNVYVSAATAWEIATKVRIGKLPAAAALTSGIGQHLVAQGFAALDVTLEHGQRAGSLPGPQRDPFDRMLIAQAQAENMQLISNEATFDNYGIIRVW